MGMNGYRPENPQIVALGTDQQRRPDGSGLAFSRAALGSDFMVLEVKKNANYSPVLGTWWLIPLSKWVTTLVVNGTSGVSPLITGVITHLQSGMNHQV